MRLFKKKSNPAPNLFSTLIDDILRLILKLLAETDPKSLINVSTVDQRLHNLCHQKIKLPLGEKTINEISLYDLAFAHYFNNKNLNKIIEEYNQGSLSFLKNLSSFDTDLIAIHENAAFIKSSVLSLKNIKKEMGMNMKVIKQIPIAYQNEHQSVSNINSNLKIKESYFFNTVFLTMFFILAVTAIMILILLPIIATHPKMNNKTVVEISAGLGLLGMTMGIGAGLYCTKRRIDLHNKFSNLPPFKITKKDDDERTPLLLEEGITEEDDSPSNTTTLNR